MKLIKQNQTVLYISVALVSIALFLIFFINPILQQASAARSSDGGPSSEISTQNSTSTPMVDGAVFTGIGELNDYADVIVAVKTDAPGTLSMQFSHDGTNWDSQLNFNVRADFYEIHELAKGSRYYRSVFTDDSDSTTATYLRLQTEFGDYEKLTSVLSGTINDDQDTLVTRTLPAFFDIARGKVQGIRTINKFGESVAGVQVTATDIWDGATSTPDGQTYVLPTQARTHTIYSNSAQDTATTGNGARTLRLYGLKTWSSLETSELINMNGTTGTTTSNSYVCIHRVASLTSGGSTPDMNIGTISVVADTDNTASAYIIAGQGQTNMAIYCLGSTETAYMTQYYGSVDKASGGVAHMDFRVRVNPNATTTPFKTLNIRGVQSTGTSGGSAWDFAPFLPIAGPAIIKIQATGSAADLEASAGFGLIIEEN